MWSADLSLIESVLVIISRLVPAWVRLARVKEDCMQGLFYEIISLANQIEKYFVNKIMQNFKIGFKFVKYLFNPNL